MINHEMPLEANWPNYFRNLSLIPIGWNNIEVLEWTNPVQPTQKH